MIFEVGGRTRSITVARDGDRWRVTADGRHYAASFVAAGPRWSLLLGAVGSAHAESHELVFERLGRDRVIVHVDGQTVTVTRATRGGRAGQVSGTSSAPRSTSVQSPMAGRVVRVAVDVGQSVVVNQALLVVEAMKMENELRAPVAGMVREVRVVPGQPVDAGALLLVIESGPAGPALDGGGLRAQRRGSESAGGKHGVERA